MWVCQMPAVSVQERHREHQPSWISLNVLKRLGIYTHTDSRTRARLDTYDACGSLCCGEVLEKLLGEAKVEAVLRMRHRTRHGWLPH